MADLIVSKVWLFYHTIGKGSVCMILGKKSMASRGRKVLTGNSRISAKTGDGKLILSHMEGEPYFFTFGKFEVPKGLEMGIGTMTRKEKMMIYVMNKYLTPFSMLQVREGYEEVHFEVELLHFIQLSHCYHIAHNVLSSGTQSPYMLMLT